MKLTEFIHAHADWEELLSAPPYSILIKRTDGYIIFSYNQIVSDFNIELVRECRGLILDEKSMKPVCVPFYKFGNYGESYVPEIDWKSAVVQEKIDGSLIKVWHDKNKWHVSTNGSVNASDANLGRTDLFEEDCPYETFADVFEEARKRAKLDFDKLDKNNTYMFELVGPYNKVVIMYKDIDIYHIGTRNNITLREMNVDIGIKKPQTFALGSLEACIASAKVLPDDKEGYVVVDKNYNRLKIKNPAYVALHHLKCNAEPSLVSLIGLIRNNEIGEFLTYFPELASKINKCKAMIDGILDEFRAEIAELKTREFKSQKDFALAVKDKKLCGFYFAWRRDENLTPEAWLWHLPDEQIRKILLNMA